MNIDDCVGVSCLNGGYCVDSVNAWSCHCPAGYSGQHCELHQLGPVNGGLSNTAMTDTAMTTCHSGKICLHNGVCIHPNATSDVVEAFCDCPLEWHGEFCEIPVCSEDACANGGRCRVLLIRPGDQTTPSKKEPYCECPPGFFGEHCLEKVFSLLSVTSPEFGIASHPQCSLQLCSSYMLVVLHSQQEVIYVGTMCNLAFWRFINAGLMVRKIADRLIKPRIHYELLGFC